MLWFSFHQSRNDQFSNAFLWSVGVSGLTSCLYNMGTVFYCSRMPAIRFKIKKNCTNIMNEEGPDLHMSSYMVSLYRQVTIDEVVNHI